jgi:hypothetical protein
MHAMSKISTDYKLAGRSVQPIYERFQAALARFKGEGRIRFQTRKMTAEAMVNAVILRFLDLPFEDQERVLAEYVPRFEAMVNDQADAEPAPVSDAPRVADHLAHRDRTEAMAEKMKGGKAKKRGGGK